MAFRGGVDMMSRMRMNRALTYGCSGTAIGVFAGWSYGRRGLAYQVLDNTVTSLKSVSLLPKSARLPNPQRVYNQLQSAFLLHSSYPNNYVSWLGSAFSHQSPMHIFFNLITWTSFAPALYLIPTRHYAALIFGSAIASSAAWLNYTKQTGRGGSALGSSGIVSGIMATVTMLAPHARASIFGIVPAPLWVITGGYFFLDSYLMRNEVQTGVGHAAHVGGGVFGVLYYAFFLRRFGGVLGR